MITDSHIQNFKGMLEAERKLLENQLADLGRQNPSNPSDWVPAKPKDDEFGADRNDNADIFEEMQDNNATLNELEVRLGEVTAALLKIDAETYGVCEESGEPIELDRLEANPAAKTCKAHMNATTA